MKKILVIYGGNSYEHEISILSAGNVIKVLDKLNYCFDQVYISKENKWFLVTEEDKIELLNIIEFLKRYDYIVAKYGVTNFIGREITPLQMTARFGPNNFSENETIMFIVIVTSISFISVAALLIIKKRRGTTIN